MLDPMNCPACEPIICGKGTTHWYEHADDCLVAWAFEVLPPAEWVLGKAVFDDSAALHWWRRRDVSKSIIFRDDRNLDGTLPHTPEVSVCELEAADVVMEFDLLEHYRK